MRCSDQGWCLFLMHLRHSQYSCGLLLVCQTEQMFLCREALLELWWVCGKLVSGILCPRGWGFTALCAGATPLPFLRSLGMSGAWSCYHGAEKEIVLVITGETCLAQKSLCRRGTGQAERVSLFLLPAGSCAVQHGLLFNLRGLLLVITACRHWERLSPGLLGGVKLGERWGGGRKKSFAVNSSAI